MERHGGKLGIVQRTRQFETVQADASLLLLYGDSHATFAKRH
jgi:hypothetical protein